MFIKSVCMDQESKHSLAGFSAEVSQGYNEGVTQGFSSHLGLMSSFKFIQAGAQFSSLWLYD